MYRLENIVNNIVMVTDGNQTRYCVHFIMCKNMESLYCKPATNIGCKSVYCNNNNNNKISVLSMVQVRELRTWTTWCVRGITGLNSRFCFSPHLVAFC